jgi:hypothetical protein
MGKAKEQKELALMHKKNLKKRKEKQRRKATNKMEYKKGTLNIVE